MTRPTARVMALLELLQSGGVRTVAELAGRLGVDERTVRRYVDHLLDLDVPVESVRGRYGGYRLGPGYRLPPLMLTDDEAVAVLLGLAVGRQAGFLADTAASASCTPAVLASLDRPFLIERPAELRRLTIALADRLAAGARRHAPRRLAPAARLSAATVTATRATVGGWTNWQTPARSRTIPPPCASG
jgi:predicted DNA-binding transcriptional regulator YafY